jgi:hypothetical protein
VLRPDRIRRELTYAKPTVLLNPQATSSRTWAPRFPSDRKGPDTFEDCYRASLPTHPDLSVRTVVNYVARNGKVVFAYTEIPQAPELERCIARKMVGWEGPPGPLALGGGLVQLGPQPQSPSPVPSAADLHARSQRAFDAAVSAGVVTAEEVAP